MESNEKFSERVLGWLENQMFPAWNWTNAWINQAEIDLKEALRRLEALQNAVDKVLDYDMASMFEGAEIYHDEREFLKAIENLKEADDGK